MTRRTGAVLALVAVISVGLLAWAGALDPRPRFELSLPGGENFDPVRVDLRDATGLVTALRSATLPAVGAGRATIENPVGEPATLALAWIGGACDERMDLALERVEGGYLLGLHTDQGFSMGCIAMGVLRGIAIELSTEVDAADVKLVWR